MKSAANKANIGYSHVTYITVLYTVINKYNKNDRTIHVYSYVWRGHAVVQMVEALRYKPEGRGFNSFRPHYGPGIDSAF